MNREQYSLFKQSGPRICFVQTAGTRSGTHGRKNTDSVSASVSFGAQAIRNDLPWHSDIVRLDQIGGYDFALLSITSVVEMERVLREPTDKRGCVVIAGGMGMLNVWPLYDLLDVAVFGRAEGQITDIINGKRLGNVWRKTDDPDVSGSYEIRQATTLLPGEAGVGCPNRCRYCQYTHIRQHVRGRGYRAGDGGWLREDDWHRLQLSTGRNITAWDGLSESTRIRVGKRILDKHIREKLIALREKNLPVAANIKIYNIVGYPWETVRSYRRDIETVSGLLRSCDGPGTRILIMFCYTPFSPEPLTPMESDTVRFLPWRKIASAGGFNGRARQVYKGESIEAFILPQIAGPLTLQKRIALNRCRQDNRRIVAEFVSNALSALGHNQFYADLGLWDADALRHLKGVDA